MNAALSALAEIAEQQEVQRHLREMIHGGDFELPRRPPQDLRVRSSELVDVVDHRPGVNAQRPSHLLVAIPSTWCSHAGARSRSGTRLIRRRARSRFTISCSDWTPFGSSSVFMAVAWGCLLRLRSSLRQWVVTMRSITSAPWTDSGAALQVGRHAQEISWVASSADSRVSPEQPATARIEDQPAVTSS